MEFKIVTKDNLKTEDICCVNADNDDIQVISKKSWLSERFDDGLVFLKSVEKGKCFIEYIPAEKAWTPIEAENYMYINCFGVRGKLKYHGYSVELLTECIRDSKGKGKKGLCILSASTPTGFLVQAKFLRFKNFEVCDETDDGIQLWYLPFGEYAEKPRFKECSRHHTINEKGYVLYYTDQCPFTAKYVPILEKNAAENGIRLHTIHITDRASAQNAPTPITNYALFHDGRYVPRVALSWKRFTELMKS